MKVNTINSNGLMIVKKIQWMFKVATLMSISTALVGCWLHEVPPPGKVEMLILQHHQMHKEFHQKEGHKPLSVDEMVSSMNLGTNHPLEQKAPNSNNVNRY